MSYTIPTARTTRVPATDAYTLPKYPAAYSITACLAHFCSAAMHLGLMFLPTRGSSAIGRCRAAKMKVYVVTVKAYPWLLPPVEEALMNSDVAAAGAMFQN